MRDYARIAPTYWTRGTGKKLRGDKDAQILSFYLMSAPAGGITGVYYLAIATVVNDTGLTIAEVEASFRRLSSERFAAYDRDAEMVWVPGLARHQIGETLGGSKDKRLAGFVRELRQSGDHPFTLECFLTYRDAYGLPTGIVSDSVPRWSWASTFAPVGNISASAMKGSPASEPDASDPFEGVAGREDDASMAGRDQRQAHVQAHAHEHAQGVTGGALDAPAPEPPLAGSGPGDDPDGIDDRDGAPPSESVTLPVARPARAAGARRDEVPPGATVVPPEPGSTPPRGAQAVLGLDDAEPAGKTRSLRATRITDRWAPTQATVDRFRVEGFDALAHVEEFINHWFNVTGAKGAKLDWDRTFVNRMKDLINWGEAKEWSPPPPATAIRPKPVERTPPTDAERAEMEAIDFQAHLRAPKGRESVIVDGLPPEISDLLAGVVNRVG